MALGIRVGIYLQWISGLLSREFLEEKDLRDVLNENARVLLVTDTSVESMAWTS
jgi:hypothetical protein